METFQTASSSIVPLKKLLTRLESLPTVIIIGFVVSNDVKPEEIEAAYNPSTNIFASFVSMVATT